MRPCTSSHSLTGKPISSPRLSALYQHGSPALLRHYEMTGNPVSIAFSEQSPPVKMHSFKLYQDTKEIKDVKILDKDNDPNRLLTERQFALFPLQPLEYDTDYRAVFQYRQNGKNRTAEWTFSTQKPDYPYFIVKGGETLAGLPVIS